MEDEKVQKLDVQKLDEQFLDDLPSFPVRDLRGTGRRKIEGSFKGLGLKFEFKWVSEWLKRNS